MILITYKCCENIFKHSKHSKIENMKNMFVLKHKKCFFTTIELTQRSYQPLGTPQKKKMD